MREAASASRKRVRLVSLMGCALAACATPEVPEDAARLDASRVDARGAQLEDAAVDAVADAVSIVDAPDAIAARPVLELATSEFSAFGDSITFGFEIGTGRYPAAVRWPERAASTLGFDATRVQNFGISASTAQTMWVDEMLPRFATAPPPDAVRAVFAGTNDARCHDADPLALEGYREALRAMIAYQLAERSVRPATDAGVVYSGTWGSFPALWHRYTSERDARAEFDADGPEVWIGTYSLCEGHSGVGSALEVLVDGATHYTRPVMPMCRAACALSGIAYPGQTFAPYVIRLEGLAPGSHRIALVNRGGGFAYLSWIASPSTAHESHVFVGNLTRNTAAGYAAHPPYNRLSDDVVDLYNGTIEEVVQSFRATSHPVQLVDLHAAFVGNLSGTGADALMQSDQAHPNEHGLSVMADAFSDRIRATLDLR
jgi:lysophospholipase L1-like esterase